jgi:uncharacterized YigZ family protein
MIDSFRTLKEPSTAQIKRKKSRFIALCYPVSSPEAVERKLSAARRSYHDATHRCYAYRLLTDNGELVHTEDAGEPAGSAGGPILQQVEKEELYDTLVVVARYFGGTKLGFGGLIRAYSDAAAEGIARAKIVEKKRQKRLSLSFPTEAGSSVMSLIHRYSARVEDVRYEDKAYIMLSLPPSRIESFTREPQEATGARACWEEKR